MQFLYVRSVVCLQLPSDPASRRTPLLFRYVLGATPCTRDFHPLERAHAERTKICAWREALRRDEPEAAAR